MAVNVLVPLLIPLGEQLTNVTKLVGSGPVELERSEYLVEAKENTRTPQHLLQLTARTQPEVAPVEFRISEGNEAGAFSLDPHTGRLSLLQPLDYEDQQQYDLVVEARVGEATSEARVVVSVLDQNDHAPVFPRSLHETQITEEDDRHLPKTILTVVATDGDGGQYGHVRYSMSGDGVYPNGTSSFAVDPETGDVLLLRPLDRDPPGGRAKWRLRVEATDGEFRTHTDVHLNLKDVNDNSPYFPSPTLTASISENTPKGSSVMQVVARDEDDPLEGHNAQLVYSLEKNAIDESSGSPIFSIDSRLGLITTALCCLDREKTQRFSIQVVATDGGGLKGTGTVLVLVRDVNDMPPRFSRPEWWLEVSERHSPQLVVATLTVVDHDVSNNFTYRVVPESGPGWQMFRVEGRRVGAPGGDLRPVGPLDYENPDHRRGFRFRVEVTDMGEEGWEDKYHVDGTWVNLQVGDANDNPPTFTTRHAHLTLPEDTPKGALLTTFTAHDLDGGGLGSISYSIAPTSNPDGRFGVDGSGAVRLVGGLDREAAAAHTLLVWAVDDGVPPRTATATLSVNVTDVNDNPPFLAEPREVRVLENVGRQEVARVRLGDPDDWRRGHGPPFTLALDPRAPPHVTAAVRVTHDKRGDEGRGLGLVTTLAPLDREEGRQLLVPLVVADAGSLSATVTLTIHVADLNDNPMTPAAKAVTVHTLQPQAGPVPLGRVYVQDPDDWAASSKTYAWRRHQPGFFLDTSNGDLTMSASTPDGRYELTFLVNDVSQGQLGVMANVTVEVKSLTPRDVTQATLLTLAVDPYKVVRQENQEETSLLRRLVVASQAWVDGKNEGVQAWVDDDGMGARSWVAEDGAGVGAAAPEQKDARTPTTRVWVAAPGVHNLSHILLYRRRELARALRVAVQDVGVAICPETAHDDPENPTSETPSCEGGFWARAVLGRGYSVVDAHTSAVVGPRLEVRRGCGCVGPNHPADDTCAPDTCLNGGRCVPTPTGTRCICPYGTWGSRCKVLSRYFEGGGVGEAGPGGGSDSDSGGWAWVPPIPTCAEVHLSLEILTTSEDAALLYSGPQQEEGAPGAASDIEEIQMKEEMVEVTPRGDSDVDDASIGASDVEGGALRGASDVLVVELRGGRPSLLLDLGAGAVTLSLNASYSLADDTWHRIDLIWKDELVEMIVDLCSGTSLDTPPTTPSNTAHTAPPDAHTCRGAAGLPRAARVLNTARPLQVGGLAHPPPAHTRYGWPAPLRPRPFRGCIRNLRINDQLVDLGEGILGRRSSPGCPAADCLSNGLHCGLHGRCHGPPASLRCECQPGWAGPGCATPTTPTSFLVNSYIKLTLSFTPLSYTTNLTLRLRTRTQRGQLVVLSSRGSRDHLTLQLVNGQLCVLLQFHPDPARSLCLTRAQVTDGRWHTVAAVRQGSATFLTVDDGDGSDLYSASVSLEGRQLLEVDAEEGVLVGGSPQLTAASNVIQIHGDYHDGCIDDLRISGRSVPLPPAINSTAWAEADVFKGVKSGCDAPPACTNVTCRAPLSCVDTWRSYNCGCREGRVLSTTKTACEDVDECVWQPCLNGGSCFNKHSAGYVCACPVGFSGQHCQLPDARETSLKLSLGALVAILVWCAFLLLLICAFLLHQHHKRAALRRGMTAEVKDNSVKEQPSTPSSHTPNLLELQLLQPPRANGQPAWNAVNPNIADVDVLQVDAASVTSSMEDQRRCITSAPDAGPRQIREGGGGGGGQEGESVQRNKSRAGAGIPASGDDLRNYAYEGEGSSPGSLSSCLESCSGSAKFLGGFREVAHMLES